MSADRPEWMDRDLAARRLGVPANADPQAVARAFRRIVAAQHADHAPGDASAAERMRLLVVARNTMLAPPPSSGVLALHIGGAQSYRGGEIEVQLPDRRPGTIEVPPGVDVGQILAVAIAGGGETQAQIVSIDHSPWTREGMDLRGTLEVSLHDIVVGAAARVATPWGWGEVRLPAGSMAPVRLRGQGMRLPGREAGHLLLDLRVAWPPAGDPLVAMALKSHRKPPRIVG